MTQCSLLQQTLKLAYVTSGGLKSETKREASEGEIKMNTTMLKWSVS